MNRFDSKVSFVNTCLRNERNMNGSYYYMIPTYCCSVFGTICVTEET